MAPNPRTGLGEMEVERGVPPSGDGLRFVMLELWAKHIYLDSVPSSSEEGLGRNISRVKF